MSNGGVLPSSKSGIFGNDGGSLDGFGGSPSSGTDPNRSGTSSKEGTVKGFGWFGISESLISSIGISAKAPAKMSGTPSKSGEASPSCADLSFIHGNSTDDGVPSGNSLPASFFISLGKSLI